MNVQQYDSRNPFAIGLGAGSTPAGLGIQETNPSGQTNSSGPINISGGDLQSTIAREQYQDYENRIVPVEDAYRRRVLSDRRMNNQVQSAGKEIDRSFRGATLDQNRDMARYGIQLTPDQKRSMNRMRAFARTSAKAGAMNSTRGVLDDQRYEALTTQVGYGRDLAEGAAQGAGNVAGMAAERDSYNRQVDAQESAQTMSTIGTIAGIALMMSSREFKENIVKADDETLARELEAMEVVEYDYKPDTPVQGHFVGLIAEDIPQRYKTEDGKQVNLYSLIGALISTCRILSSKVEALEKNNV